MSGAALHGYRADALAVKRGEMAWDDVNQWRMQLHRDFELALSESPLPERPDYELVNRFLIKARCEIASAETK